MIGILKVMITQVSMEGQVYSQKSRMKIILRKNSLELLSFTTVKMKIRTK